jgi:hypothetical protein
MLLLPATMPERRLHQTYWFRLRRLRHQSPAERQRFGADVGRSRRRCDHACLWQDRHCSCQRTAPVGLPVHVHRDGVVELRVADLQQPIRVVYASTVEEHVDAPKISPDGFCIGLGRDVGSDSLSIHISSTPMVWMEGVASLDALRCMSTSATTNPQPIPPRLWQEGRRDAPAFWPAKMESEASH